MATIINTVQNPWKGVVQWTEDFDYKQRSQVVKTIRSNLEKKGWKIDWEDEEYDDYTVHNFVFGNRSEDVNAENDWKFSIAPYTSKSLKRYGY